MPPAKFSRIVYLLLLAHALALPALRADPEEDRHTAARLAAVDKRLNDLPKQSCLKLFMKSASIPALVAAYFLIPRPHTPENRPWATLMEANKDYILVVDQWRMAGMTIDEVRALLADLKKQGDDQESVTRLLMSESILEDLHNVPREKAVRLAADGVRKGKTVSEIVDEWEEANRDK